LTKKGGAPVKKKSNVSGVDDTVTPTLDKIVSW
jgi:hypothetical protein